MRFLTPAGFGMTEARLGNNVARLDDFEQEYGDEVPLQSDLTKDVVIPSEARKLKCELQV